MDIQLTPEVQARLDQMASDTGRARNDLVEDALAGYRLELSDVRERLDRRYDEIKSGQVKLIPGNEVFHRLREKSAARRSQS
jgi:predicted transcriptional regulator